MTESPSLMHCSTSPGHWREVGERKINPEWAVQAKPALERSHLHRAISQGALPPYLGSSPAFPMLWQCKSPADHREPWFVSLLCSVELPALCPAAICSPAHLLLISSLFCVPCCCAQRWVTAQLWCSVVFCPTNFHFCFSLVPAAVERETVEEQTNYL